MTESVTLPSLSLAMDGGFVATADITRALETAGVSDSYRLIGGITVMLHVQRLRLDLPLRATGDADFGLSPIVAGVLARNVSVGHEPFKDLRLAGMIP